MDICALVVPLELGKAEVVACGAQKHARRLGCRATERERQADLSACAIVARYVEGAVEDILPANLRGATARGRVE